MTDPGLVTNYHESGDRKMNGKTDSSKDLHAHAFLGTTRDVTVWTSLLIYQVWATFEMSQCVGSCEGTQVRQDWPPVVQCVTRWMHWLAIVQPLSYYVASSHRYEETWDGLKCIGPWGEWKRGIYGRPLIDVTACEVVAEWLNSDIIYIYCIGTYMKINWLLSITKFFL